MSKNAKGTLLLREPSKEEINTAPPPPQETIELLFKRVWEEKILTQCGSVTATDVFGNPSNCVKVLDKKGAWLFGYDDSPKNKHFRYSYSRVLVLLLEEVSSNPVILRGLIKSWAENSLGLQGVTPN
jgi:hypothetical protein